MRGYRNFSLGILYLLLTGWLAYLDPAAAASTAGAVGVGVAGIIAARGYNKKHDGGE